MFDNYKFIPADKISERIFDLSEVDHEKVRAFFDNKTAEVIYVQENGALIGIITPGDLYRYYKSYKSASLYNTKFTFIDDIDYEKANGVFSRIASIHEVAIVKDKCLVGIISDNKQKSEDEWKEIHKSYEQVDIDKCDWEYSIIRKYLNKFSDIKIHLYFSPDIESIKNDKYSKLLNNINEQLGTRKAYLTNGMSGFSKMTDDDMKAYFKEMYSKEYVEEFISDYNKIEANNFNGILKLNDMETRCFNIKNGYRVTNNKPLYSDKKILFFGPCIWFGSYVDDVHTIEYYLQEIINQCVDNVEVINCANKGVISIDRMVTEKMSKNDELVIFINWYDEIYTWTKCAEEYKTINIHYNLIEAYDIENAADNLFNRILHCNHLINKRIADIIYNDIKEDLLEPIVSDAQSSALQDYYISYDILKYYRNFFRENNVYKSDKNSKNGAIVMNCNPFTKGHRYLIEQALDQVDHLYIFVVEEDKSVFKFKDRFEMVKAGTADLENVTVIPSGKYIISKDTFAQYFDKDNVTEIESMDYDIHIFAEVIAKELNISCRFAGEEPFDKVTKEYNETMRRILPNEDIEFIEIPRATTNDDEIISASAVRRLINENNTEQLKKFLPDSTIKYLQL